jgi:hypothetical protein
VDFYKASVILEGYLLVLISEIRMSTAMNDDTISTSVNASIIPVARRPHRPERLYTPDELRRRSEAREEDVDLFCSFNRPKPLSPRP